MEATQVIIRWGDGIPNPARGQPEVRGPKGSNGSSRMLLLSNYTPLPPSRPDAETHPRTQNPEKPLEEPGGVVGL